MFITLRGKMSLLAVLATVLIASCHGRVIEINRDPKYEYFLSTESAQKTKVEKFLEDFKTIMRTGSESLGIPVLDPFVADKIPFNINDEGILMEGVLSNVKVTNLSDYNVLGGDFKLLGLKFNMKLSWPQIVASTNYIFNASTDNFAFYGNGTINMTAYDFTFGTDIVFAIKDVYLKVKEVKSAVSLKKLDFNITGFMDNEELSEMLSTIISEVLPELIEEQQESITMKINQLIADKLNDFLKDKTLGDLLEIFG